MPDAITAMNLDDWSSVHNRSFEEVALDIISSTQFYRNRQRDPRYLNKLLRMAETLDLWQRGRLSESQLREVMSTSDFPILFGDILDRRLLAQYQNATTSWQQYATRGTVPDFRQSRLIAIDGLQTPFYPSAYPKPEGKNVSYDNSLAETGYTTQVQVYERGVAFSWRMMINRALNFLSRVPTLLSNGATRTEEKFATQLFIDSAGNGPNATFFSNTNKNLVNITNGATSNNPALSVQALRDALNVMYRQVDSGGDPIEITGLTLLIPPLLQITAEEILRATNFEITPATTAAGTRYVTPNWAQRINPVVNWYLPIVDTSANKHTTWYLFADPNVGRPAMEMTFLEGYEQPSLWQKAPNTMRMGGAVDPTMGQFEDMSTHIKAMHIVGGTLVDPKMAVVSNGSGS